MKYDFDEIISRKNSNSLSYEAWRNYMFKEYSPEEFPLDNEAYIRMWVADMDFSTPPEILNAIKARVDQKILGYTNVYDPEYFNALRGWFDRQYHLTINTDEVVFAPGIVPALLRLVPLLSKPDEAILINTPSYGPFKLAGDYNQRAVFYSRLQENDGQFSIDFEDLECQINDPEKKIKIFILCNPHNPSGRIWTPEELTRLGDICLANDVWIIADEIHCDLLRTGMHYTPMVKLFPNSEKVITCTAPSKTFNLAGSLNSHIFIKDKTVRAQWLALYNEMLSPLAIAATQAAYAECDEWLRQLKVYLDTNFATLKTLLDEHLPEAKFTIPESTYLAWVDISAYLTKKNITENPAAYIAKQAAVLVEAGSMFVDNGDGKIRINIACPHSVLVSAVHKIAECLS